MEIVDTGHLESLSSVCYCKAQVPLCCCMNATGGQHVHLKVVRGSVLWMDSWFLLIVHPCGALPDSGIEGNVLDCAGAEESSLCLGSQNVIGCRCGIKCTVSGRIVWLIRHTSCELVAQYLFLAYL